MRHCPEVVSMNLLQGYFVRGGRAELSSNANVLLYSNVFNLTARLSGTRSFNCRSYRWKLCSALFMGLCRWTEAISYLVIFSHVVFDFGRFLSWFFDVFHCTMMSPCIYAGFSRFAMSIQWQTCSWNFTRWLFGIHLISSMECCQPWALD